LAKVIHRAITSKRSNGKKEREKVQKKREIRNRKCGNKNDWEKKKRKNRHEKDETHGKVKKKKGKECRISTQRENVKKRERHEKGKEEQGKKEIEKKTWKNIPEKRDLRGKEGVWREEKELRERRARGLGKGKAG